MTTATTDTVRITIDAPFDQVVEDLSNAASHPEWGTEFFSSPASPAADGEFLAEVPRMGGEVHMKVEAHTEAGIIDLYLAPVGVPFGPPLPVRVLRNGGGVDVMFTLTRFPGQSDTDWKEGLASMSRELDKLRLRHEA